MSLVPADHALVLRDVALGEQPLVLPRGRRGLGASSTGGEGVMRPAGPPSEETPDIDAAARKAYEEGRLQGQREGQEDYEARWLRQRDQLLAEIRQQAIAEAGAEIQRVRDELHRQAEAAVQQHVRAIDELARSLAAEIERRLEASEDDLVALAHDMFCRVLGAHALTPEALRSQLQEALRGLRQGPLVAVRLHPDDLETLRASGGLGIGGDPPGEVQWIASQDVPLGGCILQSPEGGLDARLESQFEALRETLIRARAAHAGTAGPGRTAP